MIAIGINDRYVRQPKTGVQRYASEVSRRIAAGDGGVQVVHLAPPSGAARARYWELFEIPRDAKRRSADVVLGLCNWGPLLHQDKSVVVIHDNVVKELPSAFSPAYRTAFSAYMGAIRRGRTQIVTVSTRSKLSLERELDREVLLAPCAVQAPSEAALADWGEESRARWRLGDRGFALLIGAHDRRKNVEFARRLQPALAKNGLRLVTTSRTDRGQVFGTSPANTDSTGEIDVPDPDDRELWGLYASAAVVLQPSLAEGFGLPLLEAAASGTPFLSSPVGAAEDIAVNDYQIADLNEATWANRIEWVVANRESLSKTLRIRAAAFDWSTTAGAIRHACLTQHRRWG